MAVDAVRLKFHTKGAQFMVRLEDKWQQVLHIVHRCKTHRNRQGVPRCQGVLRKVDVQQGVAIETGGSDGLNGQRIGRNVVDPYHRRIPLEFRNSATAQGACAQNLR